MYFVPSSGTELRKHVHCSYEVLISATRSQVYANYSCLHVLRKREVTGRVVVVLTNN